MKDYKAFAKHQKTLDELGRSLSWGTPTSGPESGQLFSFLTPHGRKFVGGHSCGCATQVYHGTSEAALPEVTDMVRNCPVRICDPSADHKEPITDGDLDQIALIQIEARKIFKEKGLLK